MLCCISYIIYMSCILVLINNVREFIQPVVDDLIVLCISVKAYVFI